MTIEGHFWVENDEGKVIFDLHWDHYDEVCSVNKCDINKPRYRKASKERQREMILEQILPQIQNYKMMVKQLPKDTPITEDLFSYHPHMCGLNVATYKFLGNEGIVCYGDKGWAKLKQNKNKPEKIWWEYEDAYVAPQGTLYQSIVDNFTKMYRINEMKEKFKEKPTLTTAIFQ